jgi:hypothetical protein
MGDLLPYTIKNYTMYIPELKYAYVVMTEAIEKIMNSDGSVSNGDILYRTVHKLDFQEDFRTAYYDHPPVHFPEDGHDIKDHLKIRRTMYIHTYAGSKYASMIANTGENDSVDPDDLSEYNDFNGWLYTQGTWTQEITVLNPKKNPMSGSISFKKVTVPTQGQKYGAYGPQEEDMYLLNNRGKLVYYSLQTQQVVINVGEGAVLSPPNISWTPNNSLGNELEVVWYNPDLFDPTIDPLVDPSQGTEIPITGSTPDGTTQFKIKGINFAANIDITMNIIGNIYDDDGYTSDMINIALEQKYWHVPTNPVDLNNPLPEIDGIELPPDPDADFVPLDQFDTSVLN